MALPLVGLKAVIEGLNEFKSSANLIAKGYDFIGKESDEAAVGSKKFSQAVNETKQPVSGLSSLVDTAKKAIVGYVAALGVREIVQFGKETVQAYQRLAAGKGALLATVGSTQAYNEAIDKAREATQGMVSEAELASSVNILLASHLADSADEAAELANAGNILVGVFSAQGATMEKFGKLLASGNQVLLDNFGLTLDMVQAKQKDIEATTDLTGQEARLKAIRELALESAAKYESAVSDSEKATRQWQAATEDLKAALGEQLAPQTVTLVSSLTDLVRGMTEARAAEAEQREEIFKSSGTFEEYATNLAKVGLLVDMTSDQFSENKSQARALALGLDDLSQAERGLAQAAQESAEAEGMTAQERRIAGEHRIEYWQAIEDAARETLDAEREANEKALEEAKKTARAMLDTTATYFLDLRGMQSEMASSEQEFQAGIAGARAAAGASQADAQQKLDDKLVELAQQREEKLHWVLTGAHARTQAENDRDLAYWNEHFDTLEADARNSYAAQNADIIGKLNEREAALSEARAKEEAAQQEALERLKLVAALSILESQGQLEAFTGGMATSAEDAAGLIEAGVLPVTRDMAFQVQTLVGDLAVTNEEAMTRSQANATLLTQALSGDIEQTARPSVQSLDLDFQNISGITLPGMQTTGTVAAASLRGDMATVANSLVGEGGVKSSADEATDAMKKGFEEAGDKIKEKLIPKLKDLEEWLKKVKSAAEDAARATGGLGGAAGGAGAPGFQAGGMFVVPSGFPNDTFPLRVSSGEVVNIIPRQEAIQAPITPAMAAAGVMGSATNTNNYFSMTVNTAATSGTVVQDFNIMRSLLGD